MNGASDVNYQNDMPNGLPGDWARIKQYADEYVANPTANLWQGSTVQGTNYPVYEGVKLQQAAFCYLMYKDTDLAAANKYAAAVRLGLLQQITITAANISLWNLATVGENGVNESRWITRLVMATDYIKDYLSVADKTLLNTWFLAQATFMANHIQAGGIGQSFPRRLYNDYTVVGRDAKPTGESYGIYVPGKYPDGFEYTHVNANGSLGNKISQLAIWWNNRNADKANMIGMVGHLLNNSNLIFQAKQYAKEWLKYSVYPDGTMGEYQRNGDYNIPQQGMSYGAVNMWQYIMLADACARKGDMELYNYSTSEGLHGTAGGPKTLRLTVEKYCKNMQANPAIYCLNTNINNRLDSYGEAANVELMWDVLFSIPNKLWQSNYITSIYTRTAPGVRPYPTSGTGVASAAQVWYPWGGTGAEYPGVLFQNGQMESLIRPYATTVTVDVPVDLRIPYVLQRCTRFIWDQAIGAIKYNLRYRPTASTTWTTLSALPYTWIDTKALTPGTAYEWQVQSVGVTITSAWSPSSYFSTPAACSGGTGIVREQWNNQTGYYVWQSASLPFARTASSKGTISTLEMSANTGASNYVSRTRGFVCAPQTGAYTFWLSGDDEAELWLSTDDDPANAVKLIYTKWTNVREFTKYSTQKSASINLIANQRYYIEVRQMQVGGNDHFCVRWQMPDATMETPIAASRISPYSDNKIPTVTLGVDRTSYTAGDDVVLSSTATDTDGTVIRVEYYSDTTMIGYSTKAPYSYTYQDLPAGTYNFKAMAVDNTGDKSVAATQTVVVGAAAAASACATGQILWEFWANVTGNEANQVPTTNPTTVSTVTMLETPTNQGDNYGERLRGYICPPVSGNYTFWVAGDNKAEVWLAKSEDSTGKQRICFVTTYTGIRQYNKEASQQSAPIALVAGQKYYIEVVHKEGSQGDNLSVQWQLPSGALETPIPATRLSPYTGPVVCKATGNITRETWNNITGDISTMNWNSTPWWSGTHISLEPPRNINDNYAQRLRGFICPPATGSYTFQLSADDQAELWLSTDEKTTNATKVAFVNGATAFRTFTTFATQQYTVNLVANRRYYIEIRHREVTGDDHVTVAWTLPTGVTELPIPGSRLANFASGGVREGVEEAAATQATPAGDLKLTLYPNPAKESVWISASEFAGNAWEIALLTQVGSEIKRFTPSFSDGERQTELRLDELNLTPGIYILRVRDGQGRMHNLRFVKQN